MKALIIGYCAGSIIVALLFATLLPIRDEEPDAPCNFCSGSGKGEDCPRFDKQARLACLESVRSHYCGQRPSQCG